MDKEKAAAGDSIKLTATPATGYELDSYSVTDSKGSAITVTSGEFKMPASSVTVSATFKETQASKNQTAADAVIAKINAIGTVAYTSDSKALIDAAREAYDALTSDQQALVTNYSTLTAAESAYSAFALALLGVPFTLKALTAGTIVVNSPKTGMQYSLNGGTKTAVTSEITVAVNDEVAFYGNGTEITYYNGTQITGGTATVKLYGNIMSLVDEENFATADTLTANYAFYCLFRDNTNLTDASGLLLPATTLTDSCYRSLFLGCEKLVSAPELPATELTRSCYYQMFSSCALTSAPVLPATTMAEYCYYQMFAYNDSLTEAPELPATELAANCYSRMFASCTKLESAPALPVTDLAEYCYSGMFDNCEALTEAPELPATTLANDCYKGMFSGCEALTEAPELPATTLAEACYSSMFAYCEMLTAAPELPATILARACYSGMFSGCEALTEAPELPATTLAEACYSNMFSNCTSLTAAPVLPATTLVANCYWSMFTFCENLSSVTCLATNISAEKCTQYWMDHVGATGTFTKAAGMNDWTTGDDGIPSGWTVAAAN